MRAVVLVGGKGTRLRPLTWTTPKQMLPVAGRPMIERVLAHLAGFGIDEVVLSLGYRPDAFMDAYPDATCAGVALTYAVEDHPLDTAGAIAFAARSAGIDETFVVVNGDVLTGLDMSALVDLHRTRGAEATIALTPVEDPSAFGVVPTDADDRVEAFIEKPPRDEAPTNNINAGTYVLEPGVLDLVPEGAKVSIERETFPALVARGGLYALASSTPWLDAGTPATFRRANLDHPDAGVAAGVDVPADATVTGSVVGSGSTVGAGASVSGSVLFAGVDVGAQASITDALIGFRATIGAGASIGAGAVLGDDVVVPEGGVVAPGESLDPPSQ